MEQMKNLIKHLLREGIKNLPYDERPEMKQYSYPSLSDPSFKFDINKLKFRMAKAAQLASDFKQTNPNDEYFNSPNEGNGFYQVEFRHDGQIKTKHIKASGDMNQLDGPFQPSDVGTCKNFQNIAKYCFVKAGKPMGDKYSVGVSPADDAANKALIIYRDEILDFFHDGSYVDDKAADISKEKTPDEWKYKFDKYEKEKQRQANKPEITMDPDELAKRELQRQMAADRIAKAKARMNK